MPILIPGKNLTPNWLYPRTRNSFAIAGALIDAVLYAVTLHGRMRSVVFVAETAGDTHLHGRDACFLRCHWNVSVWRLGPYRVLNKASNDKTCLNDGSVLIYKLRSAAGPPFHVNRALFWIKRFAETDLLLQSLTLQQIVIRGIMQCCRLVGTDEFSAWIGNG